MDRKTFIKTTGIILAGGITGNAYGTASVFAGNNSGNNSGNETGNNSGNATFDFPLTDLHVHRSDKQTIEDIVALSEATGIKFGVMENVAPWGIRNDDDLKTYLDAVTPYPVYVGLQPMSPGWTKNLSPELIARADYVAMDPQIVPNGNKYGETIYLWEYASYIDDPDYFMERNMEHYMDILTGNEPLDIFACPFLLPASIEREYPRLWTTKRQEQIIEAARERDIAIEINDLVRVPHEEFIGMGKRAGLKFTFGSDTRDQKTGRLDYCKYIAKKC